MKRLTNRRVTLITAFAGNFSVLGSRLLLGAVVPIILIEFDASKSSIGLAMTGMWAIYALLQFPSGVLSDRYGEYRIILVGLVATALGMGLVALSPSLLAYGIFVLVLGAGTGLFFSPTSSLLSRLFGTKGSALGVLTAGGSAAGVVYPAVGGLIATRFGWRVAVFVAAAVVLPVLVAAWWRVPSKPPVSPEQELSVLVDSEQFIDVLSRPSIVYTILIGVMVGFAFQAFSSFFPTFLFEYRGLGSDAAGLLFGAIFGLSAVMQPIAGRLSDKFSRDTALSISITLAGLGFLILLTITGLAGLLAGSLLLGLGISWPGVVQARFIDQLDDDEIGFGFGLIRSVYLFFAASGSLVVGSLVDLGGWMVGYGFVVALFSICLLVIGANRFTGAEL